MNNLIVISTFKKPLALQQILETLIKFDYHQQSKILITDDDCGSAKEIFDEFKDKCNLSFSYGLERKGIAINKNRGIKYFLDNKKFEDVLFLDDDQLFIRPGLIDRFRLSCKRDNLKFSTGMWTDFKGEKEEHKVQDSGLGWFAQFPILASTDYHTFHAGCHGSSMYLTREAVTEIGYMNLWQTFYGFEHSLYMSRLLRFYKMCPEYFPILKYTEYYLHGNNIPNNYEVDIKQVFATNGQQHKERLKKVYDGYELYQGKSGLGKGEKIK